MRDVYPVLLAGGSGTRLWPVSRELYPKQLVKFIGEDSLIQNTIKRLSPTLDSRRVRVVCGSEHYDEIARHMETIGLPAQGRVIREPCGRNTAPAILLAALSVIKAADDPILCVFPADHVIRDMEKFHENIRTAIRLAAAGHIVTFGIQPYYPETGYGYIEGADPIDAGAFSIRRFVEKPDLETAKAYIDAGNFFWNSGMFAFSAAAVIEEFRAHKPAMLAAMTLMLSAGSHPTLEAYGRLESISFDYAVMENTAKGVVLPSDFGWSDIGSWKSLYDFLPKDSQANVIDGDVITRDTRRCFITAYNRLIATNHVEGLVVVETPDSVFVSDIDHSRDVKAIVEQLKASGREEYHRHGTVHLPWGRLMKLVGENGYAVYQLVVYPKASFDASDIAASTAHMVVVSGAVTLLPGNRVLNAGEASTIGRGASTTIRNTQDRPAVMICVEPDCER